MPKSNAAAKKTSATPTKAKALPIFIWEGTTKTGAKVKGEISAASLVAVKTELRRQGIGSPVIKKKPSGLFAKKEKKIKTPDLTVFTRQLATMMAAGIPLAQSFDIVGRGHENPSMRKLINEIKLDVEAGNALADAFRKYPKYFSELFCNLIAAGEASGSLETMLKRLATYMEKSETIKKKIKKALTYPIVVLCIAFGVSAVLLIFVVPQFQAVFGRAGAELPALTLVIVHMSEWLQQYWYFMLGGIGFGIYSFVHALKTSASFQYNFDKAILRTPIFGNIIVKALIARYARTLSTTFAAGMPLVEALGAVAGAVGNKIYCDAILVIRDKVSTGTQLQIAMTESQLFPNMVIQMVSIGEESGALESMLSKVADYYEEIVDHAVDNLATLLEPIIMCILAVIVGTMVVAMYLPIFNMGNAV